MTADNDSLLNAVFSAVTLPPVSTVSRVESHHESHEVHVQSSQVYSATATHFESHTSESHVISAHHQEQAHVEQKLAYIHADDAVVFKRDSLASQQSVPRSIRARSTASSEATSHTSDSTITKIDSALAQRTTLTMGGIGSKPDWPASANSHPIPQPQPPSAPQSRVPSAVSSRKSSATAQSIHSHHSTHSHNSYHSVASDESESTLKDEEHAAPTQIHAVAPPAHHEISEEIVHEDSTGHIVYRGHSDDSEEYPPHAPPPVPEEAPPRSPLPTNLLSDLRNHALYRQARPDDETSTTISEAHIESVLGGHTNGYHAASDDSDSESEIGVVVLRSVVKKDFDSHEVVAVENPAIRRQPSHVKPLDEKLKTELQQAMQTRAIEDDSASSTLSHESEDHHSLHHEDHAHQEPIVYHSAHHSEHGYVEPPPVHQVPETAAAFAAVELSHPREPPAEPEWEPRRFSSSSSRNSGYEQAVFGEKHHTEDEEGTLTSHDGIPPARDLPLRDVLTKRDSHDYPSYLHGSVSSATSSHLTGASGHQNRGPMTGAFLHRSADGSQQIRIGHGALPPRRDTASSVAASESSTATYQSHNAAPVITGPLPPQPQLPGGHQRPRNMSKGQFSTVSSIALIPNLYDQPRVTEPLRSVRADDVLHTLAREQQHFDQHHHHHDAHHDLHHEDHHYNAYDEVHQDDHHDEPVYDHVHDGHHHEHDHHHHHHEHHHDHDHHEHHHEQPALPQHQPKAREHYDSVCSDGFVHVKRPLRGKKEYHLPLGDHFVLKEGVNTLRGRWENRNFHHEDTDDEYARTLGNLDKALHSHATSTIQTKSRASTNASNVSASTCASSHAQSQAKSAVSASSCASKHSQAKSAVSASTATGSVVSQRSKQSAPALKHGIKSRTSTLQQIHEHEELKTPAVLHSLTVEVGHHDGPVLTHTPVTSPAYNDRFQSLRVVKSVRQFVQQIDQPGQKSHVIVPAPRTHVPPPVPEPDYDEVHEPVAAVRTHAERRESVLSDATSVSVNSSVSQQSQHHHHKKCLACLRSLPPTPKVGSVAGSVAHSAVRSHQGNGTVVSHGGSHHSHHTQQSHHTHQSHQPSHHSHHSHHHSHHGSHHGSQASHHSHGSRRSQTNTAKSSKRSSVDSQATLTNSAVNHHNGHADHQHHEHHEHHVEHHQKPMSPAFEEPVVTEYKVRAETHVLTDLVPLSQRRQFFESTDTEIKRNFSINRKNVKHDHSPPMVNLLA